MNAYELADELEKWRTEGGEDLTFKTHANMLRQQADRIRDLEMSSDMDGVADLLQHQADYISFLEKALESSMKLNKAQAERKT